MKKLLISSFRIFISFLILIVIFRKVNFHSLYLIIDNLEWKYCFFGLAYFFIYPIMGIERWRYMVNINKHLSFLTALKIYFIGETINLILPAKGGDLSKALYLKKTGICTLTFGTSTVIFEKLLDLIAISCVFIAGWLLNGMNMIDHPFWILGTILLTIVIFILFLVFDKLVFPKWLFNKYVLEKTGKGFKELQIFLKDIRQDQFKLIIFIMISIVFWFGHCFQIHLFFRSALIDISYIDTIMIMPIVFIVSFLPITVGGFGTREAVLMWLLANYANTENIALACILISLRYIIPALIGLLFIQDSKLYNHE